MKFKLTEFGTLEIVSTVETDKGEYEWSTKTEHQTMSDSTEKMPPSKDKATSQGT